MEPEQQQEIANLRALNLTPKQIARKLELRVADVANVIKQQAAQAAATTGITGELAPVTKCLINGDIAQKLLPRQPLAQLGQWLGKSCPNADNNLLGGLALVTVARQPADNRLLVCNYLVDVWCLGVKNTLGPRKLDRLKYEQLIKKAYDQFPGEPQEITLAQAQAVVFNATDYAAQLGFQPHADFNQTRAHLGHWSGQPKIECGRNGKPFYVDGPYDNSRQIIATLQQNVGEGNFDFLITMGE